MRNCLDTQFDACPSDRAMILQVNVLMHCVTHGPTDLQSDLWNGVHATVYINAVRPVQCNTIFWVHAIHQRMGQLFNLLRDTDVLAWDFFLGRLDLLSMEAHVGMENATDLGAFPTGELSKSVLHAPYFTGGKVHLSEWFILYHRHRIPSWKNVCLHRVPNWLASLSGADISR